MAYSALTLITRAYYLSQVVAREGQTVSGSQISDGLFLLNALLDVKGSDLRLIPYFTRHEFNLTPSIDSYFIENLLAVDAMTFNLGVVRYPMIDMSRKQFFATPRVDNVTTLPMSYRCERELGGMRIYFYFVPDQAYPVKLSGKFGFDNVELTTDLSTTFDGYYIEYLRFALAEYICSDYGQTFPDQSYKKFNEIRKKLMVVNPPDLTLQTINYFDSGRGGLSWQQINLGDGFTPS